MQETPKVKNHTVMLDNRGKLVMTGAEDVPGFNEETVSVKTSCGCLVIKGEIFILTSLTLKRVMCPLTAKLTQCSIWAAVRQNQSFQNFLSRCNFGTDFLAADNGFFVFADIRHSGGAVL